MSELDVTSCWELVRAAGLARLGFVLDGAINVLPVNVAVHDRSVVFRTADGTGLHAAADGREVVVEVDGFDPYDAIAWSVVVRGRCEEVLDVEPGLRSAVEGLSWHDGSKPHVVRVRPTAVTGRRFRMVNAHRRVVGPG